MITPVATVLLLRCQVSPSDLVAASRALERAGLRVERAVAHPEPVITAVVPITSDGAVLGVWADAADAAAVALGGAGVRGDLALVGVQERDAAGVAALSR